MNIRLGIIENQQSHFNTLSKLLSENKCDVTFEIIPEEEHYGYMTDLVRICLDCRYSNDKRLKAEAQFIKKMVEFRPDLLIVDQVLLGFSSTATENSDGIELIINICKKSDVLNNIPSILLSSALRHDPTILKRLRIINNNERVKFKPVWKSKKPVGQVGPFGDQDYFDKHIIWQIIDLVRANNISLEHKELAARVTNTILKVVERGEPHKDLVDQRAHCQEIIDYLSTGDTVSVDFVSILSNALLEIEQVKTDMTSGPKRDCQIAKIIRQVSIPK